MGFPKGTRLVCIIRTIYYHNYTLLEDIKKDLNKHPLFKSNRTNVWKAECSHDKIHAINLTLCKFHVTKNLTNNLFTMKFSKHLLLNWSYGIGGQIQMEAFL